MLSDRYGLALSTTSAAARDAYAQATDRALTFYPGALEGYDRAIAADPGFALAHAGKAQVLMRQGDLAAHAPPLQFQLDRPERMLPEQQVRRPVSQDQEQTPAGDAAEISLWTDCQAHESATDLAQRCQSLKQTQAIRPGPRRDGLGHERDAGRVFAANARAAGTDTRRTPTRSVTGPIDP